jgi:hypothetical protein
LCGDGRWVEDGIRFVDSKRVGPDILKISRYERAKLRKKRKGEYQNDLGEAERGERVGKDSFQE